MPSYSQEDEFETWFNNDHINECEMNFSGPSTEMERFSLKKMFERSVETSNLVYKWLVSDGDCKGFNDVLLTYELCNLCKNVAPLLSNKSGK